MVVNAFAGLLSPGRDLEIWTIEMEEGCSSAMSRQEHAQITPLQAFARCAIRGNGSLKKVKGCRTSSTSIAPGQHPRLQTSLDHNCSAPA